MQVTGIEDPEIVVCTRCARLRGTATIQGKRYKQRCRCNRDEKPARGEPRWGDFPIFVELCYACVAVPIPSGSRFSLFYCPDCKARIMQVNARAGGGLIPLGRHTLMAGGVPALSGSDLDDRSAVGSFTLGAKGFFVRIDILDQWTVARVIEILRGSPWKDAAEVPIDDYLGYVNRDGRWLRRDELFLSLCVRFGALQHGVASL